MKRILLLGDTGKIGTAVSEIFGSDPAFQVCGYNSSHCGEELITQAGRFIDELRPDIVFNAAAFQGVDPAEREPERAIYLNTIVPMRLAKLSREKEFRLVHFSSESVFGNEKTHPCDENESPAPVNFFSFTKASADQMVKMYARDYYIFRLPVIFGPSRRKHNQFVEMMTAKLLNHEPVIRVASDITTSPTYTLDAVTALKAALTAESPSGVYHLANSGEATLFEIVCELKKILGSKSEIESISYRDLPHLVPKSTYTPLVSVKMPALRPWREALAEYCREFAAKERFE